MQGSQNCVQSTVCPEGLLGAWQRPEQTRWVEESSGSLWSAKSWYPQTVRNPKLGLGLGHRVPAGAPGLVQT